MGTKIRTLTPLFLLLLVAGCGARGSEAPGPATASSSGGASAVSSSSSDESIAESGADESAPVPEVTIAEPQAPVGLTPEQQRCADARSPIYLELVEQMRHAARRSLRAQQYFINSRMRPRWDMASLPVRDGDRLSLVMAYRQYNMLYNEVHASTADDATLSSVEQGFAQALFNDRIVRLSVDAAHCDPTIDRGNWACPVRAPRSAVGSTLTLSGTVTNMVDPDFMLDQASPMELSLCAPFTQVLTLSPGRRMQPGAEMKLCTYINLHSGLVSSRFENMGGSTINGVDYGADVDARTPEECHGVM
jgi:hypothetical protein